MADQDPNLGSSRSDTDDGVVTLSGGGDDSGINLVFVLIPAAGLALVILFFFAILRYFNRRGSSHHRFRKATQFQKEKVKDSSQDAKLTCRSVIEALRFSDAKIRNTVSFDAYFLLRYMKILVVICFAGCLLTWTVLLPISSTGDQGEEQLQKFSLFNNSPHLWKKFYANVACAWVFVAFIFALVTREHLCCLRLQFEHSRSTFHTTSISSRLILITDVSEKLAKIIKNSERVERVRGFMGTKFLEDKVRKRTELAMQLEALEIAQIRSFNREMPSTLPKSLAKFEIRYEIRKLDTEIRQIQKNYRDAEDEASRAMLVELKNPTDIRDLDSLVFAQDASISHIGLEPENMIWSNLNSSKAGKIFKDIIITTLIAISTFILFIPAIVGILLEQYEEFTSIFPFLQWMIYQTPTAQIFVSSVLPVLYMSVIKDILGALCQYGAYLIGFPTEAAVQMKAQRIFLATQIVLVILGETIVPGAVGIIHPGTIMNPSSIPQLLAPDLVKGSNFCMQYMTLDSLGHFSLYLLEGESYMRVRFKSLFDDAPRKILHHRSNIHELKWCEAFPEITIFGVAAITYSCIAPLVLGFACAGLSLYYLGYRYKIRNLQMKYVNTHGEVYHTALQQTLIGCYLLILLLALLFALSAGGESWFIGPIYLLALLLLLCIVYHSFLNNALSKFENCKRGGDPVQASPGLIGNPLVKLFSRYLDINTQKCPEAGIEEQLDDIPSLNADWEKYFPPCVITKMPTIWVPRDSHGHSMRQIEESLYLGIPMTNEGARLDENGKIHLAAENLPS